MPCLAWLAVITKVVWPEHQSLAAGRCRPAGQNRQACLLRTYGVVMSRGGKPEAGQVKAIGDQLDPHFPAKDDNLNEELAACSVTPTPLGVEKTVALMQTTKAKVPDFDAEVMKRNGGYGGRIPELDGIQPQYPQHSFSLLPERRYGGLDHGSPQGLPRRIENPDEQEGRQHVHRLHPKDQRFRHRFRTRKDRPSLQYLMGDIKSIDISNLPKAKGPRGSPGLSMTP